MELGEDLRGETFFMDDVKLETPSARKKEVNELSLDTEQDEVQEIHVDFDKKN
jgi:hypothetical protein